MHLGFPLSRARMIRSVHPQGRGRASARPLELSQGYHTDRFPGLLAVVSSSVDFGSVRPLNLYRLWSMTTEQPGRLRVQLRPDCRPHRLRPSWHLLAAQWQWRASRKVLGHVVAPAYKALLTLHRGVTNKAIARPFRLDIEKSPSSLDSVAGPDREA